MLPEKVIPARIERGVVVPFFLTTQDHPWLAILIDEIDRFSGRPRRELWERLRAPLPCAGPFFKGRAATAVLLRLWRAVEEAAVAPPAAREAVFVAAAAAPEGATRAGIFAEAAAALGVGGDAGLEGALFADLPGERIVRAPSVVPPAAEAALRVNLAIARSLLQRASIISIQLEGAARPVVRQAQWRGLLCTLRAAEPPELEVSGPFALFRRTVLYGRALGEMLPFLARTGRYLLRARCYLGGQEGVFTLRSGDPILPAAPTAPFDSRVEERFARDFKRAAPAWDLVREPEAIRAGDTLIFPDFLIRHRLDPRREHLLEIVGFWTADYLRQKLERLRAAGIQNLVLAIDEDRRCADDDLPAAARVLRYRRRIDPAAVLRLIA